MTRTEENAPLWRDRDGADALSSRHLLVAAVITLVDLVVIVGIGIYLLACTQFLQYKSIESRSFRCFLELVVKKRTAATKEQARSISS